MKYIDISTSHNISIRYELASVMQRILAWFIDIMILLVYVWIVSIVAVASTFLWYFLIFFVFAFYHLFFEILYNGQSPGKMLIKIKVVTLHGRTAKMQDYFMRWIFRVMEITFTGGILATVYISTTEKHQRIGDLLAQTTVIKLIPDNHYSLDGLVKLADRARDITYPKVVMYNDIDLMLVKDAIVRIRKYPNDQNKRFILTLSNRIAEELNIKITEKTRVAFLETVLLDYITLTR